MVVKQTIVLLRLKVNFDYPEVRFHCVRCGICCGDTKDKNRHVLLLKTEAKQIAEATLQPIFQFAVEIKGRTPYSYEMKKSEDGKCVFLENKRCTIYPIRPLICRFYPFELKVLHNKKYTFLYTEECPGINKGRLLSEDYFRRMFRTARAKFRLSADSNGKS
jgi:Fe-S-cluster containining protein